MDPDKAKRVERLNRQDWDYDVRIYVKKPTAAMTDEQVEQALEFTLKEMEERRSNELNHLLPEFFRVWEARSRHCELLSRKHKGVHVTGSTPKYSAAKAGQVSQRRHPARRH